MARTEKQFSPRFGMNRMPRGNVAEIARMLVAERNGGEPKDVVFDAENQLAINDAKMLINLAKRAHRWAELACTWTGEDDANKTKSDAQVLAEAMAIGQRYNVQNVNIKGDPRGYVLYLVLKSGRFNTWGGKEHGYGIANTMDGE